jgi:hypothetical protein
MQDTNVSLLPRRSSRVSTSIPVLVTSLDPAAHFSEVCETMVVNAHGCAMRSRTKVETGMRLRFRSREGRDTTAQVVSCEPIGSDTQSWILGARLDRPDNFWGLRNCPKDWAAAAGLALPFSSPRAIPATAGQLTSPAAQSTIRPSEVAADDGARLRAEEYVKRIVRESIAPLHSEIVTLREKILRKEANPSRFDISLSSIPPELEQQLELRLRKGLEPKILDQARQQSAHLLAEARTAIESKTKEVHERFSQQLTDERRVLERRAHEISTQVSENIRERLGRGLKDFERQLLEGGNQLKQLSEELLEFLQTSLTNEHNARRGDLEQLRAMITGESSRLQQSTAQMDSRIAKLNDSVQSLESGLDQRLSQMYSRVVRDTRTELEGTVSAILTEFTTRSAQAFSNQLDEACEKMSSVQKGIIESVSGSLDSQMREALKTFQESMQDMARASVGRWRQKLGTGLSALAKSLDEQFQLEPKSSGDEAAK